MNISKSIILIAFGITMSSLSAVASTPLWMRDASISPDGKKIAFSYKGDIYTVPTSGGSATRLTTDPAYDGRPTWSPDGKKIAFATDRNGGSFDVYVMASDGGAAQRLTTHSASETPEAFTPDGKYVVYSAAIQAPATSAQFPNTSLTQLYKVPVGGGAATMLIGSPALYVDYVPGTNDFVYQDVKGFEDKFRKHHTSSVTRDIWRYNAANNTYTLLINNAGEDLNPVVSPDAKQLYFLSERNGGSMNVYRTSLNAPSSAPEAITSFKRHPVRYLSIADNGMLAFTYDGEIYTLTPGGKPTKVAIDLVTDDNPSPVKYLRSTRASDGAPSRDGKQFAFVSRGEVFVTSTDHNSVKQITHTPEGESNVSWGKDGRDLYYTSERDGYYNIYRASIARPDDPNFSNATLVKEERVFPDDHIDRTYPQLSPDGKKLAYVKDRNKLMVMNLSNKKEKQLTDGTTNPSRTKGFEVQWSPDGRYLLIENIKASHQPYSDISVVDVETGKIHDITNTGYFDQSPSWALDGKAVLFVSERYGMRNHASWGSQYDVMLAFLDKDAYDRFRLNEEDYALLKEVEKAQKKKETKKDAKSEKKPSVGDSNKKDDEESAEKDEFTPDFDMVEERTLRLTPNSSDISAAYLMPDGETLYYLSENEDGYDLWKTVTRKKETRIAKKLAAGPSILVPDSEGNIFILGNSVKKYTPKSDKVATVTTSAKFPLDVAAEREYMLRHVYNEVRERFYVKDLNGVDWTGLYKDYKKFLPHINNDRDFADMLSELLGELNVSHTGGRYRGGQPSQEPTASLGLLYDYSYTGNGLKVAEVVIGGPFDRKSTAIAPGSIITEINGEKITPESDFSALLGNMSGKKTLVTFTNGKDRHEEVVLPITSSAFNELMYNRWIAQREKDVEKWSGGRLGYVHLRSMNDDSFRKIYAKTLGKYRDLDGIVIDTRWNGGGRLHEDIEVLFSAEPYLMQDIHGMVTSVMPSRRWTKPSIMLIGEANYSNAHGTPWVYKHKNLGKLVGMPVPGTMSSVNWETLQNPDLVYGIPVIGFRTAEGNYLENTQLEPDVKIANEPRRLLEGTDMQLREAVEQLMKEINSKSKK